MIITLKRNRKLKFKNCCFLFMIDYILGLIYVLKNKRVS
jgi:hypothetical protein